MVVYPFHFRVPSRNVTAFLVVVQAEDADAKCTGMVQGDGDWTALYKVSALSNYALSVLRTLGEQQA